MAYSNTRHPDSSARVPSRAFTAFTLALICSALLAQGVNRQTHSAEAPTPNTRRMPHSPSAKTAGLLVPKRVRLIINYSRTALA